MSENRRWVRPGWIAVEVRYNGDQDRRTFDLAWRHHTSAPIVIAVSR